MISLSFVMVFLTILLCCICIRNKNSSHRTLKKTPHIFEMDRCPKCGAKLWERTHPPITLCENYKDGEQYDIIGNKNCDFAFKKQPNIFELYNNRHALWFYTIEGGLSEKLVIVDKKEYTWIYEKDIILLYEKFVTYTGIHPNVPPRI